MFNLKWIVILGRNIFLPTLTSLYFLTCTTLVFAGIDDTQIEKLGNFLDNAFANMSDEEKELFAQEVQLEQEKLMKMSPEERAAREDEVSQQLNELIDSPYGEWFEKPSTKTIPDLAPEFSPKAPAAKEDNDSQSNVAPTKAATKRKPKAPPIGKDIRNQSKQNMQNIMQAVDSILLKTNQMQEIHHSSWNKGKWLNLNLDLQTLKSQIPAIINSDLTLVDLVSIEQHALRQDLLDFENLIVQQAAQLKTPDAMGLVVLFEGQPKIIDQARYDAAVLKLKKITDSLSQKLQQTDLVRKTKYLIDKHNTQTIKPKSKSDHLESQLNDKITKNNLNTSLISDAKPTCAPITTRDLVLQQALELATNIKKCANKTLLDLIMQYQNQSTGSPVSGALLRKLQWKLSELEVYLGKLAKLITQNTNCSDEIINILDFKNINQDVVDINLIINGLNKIDFNADFNQGLNTIKSQINTHKAKINF